MLRKLVIIHLTFLALAVSMLYLEFSGPNLTWNMGLALIALNFSVLLVTAKRWYLKLPFFLLWLFFYPNTFYMLTDIVHMGFASTVLWEPASLLLFMIYVPSILLGVLSGVLSVRYAFEALKLRQPYLRLFLIGLLSLIASCGIHIGRYARLNSWDLFTRPQLVIAELLALFHRDTLLFIIGFTFIQVMVLVFVEDDR